MKTKIYQNEYRRAAVCGGFVTLSRNVGKVREAWRQVWPRAASANPEEAARVWVEDCVVMFNL